MGKSWLELGFFDRKAVIKAVNAFISEREKKTNEKTKAIEQAILDQKPQRSLFEGVPMPKM